MRESDKTEIAMVENSHQQCSAKIKVSAVEIQEDHICDCLHALREEVKKSGNGRKVLWKHSVQ